MRKNWLIQNTAARFVHSNCNLGRFAIVALFLLSFLVSGAWAVCKSPSLYNIPISPTCYFPSSTQNGCGNCCQNATIPRNVVVTSSFYSNSSGPGMPYTCGCRISNPLLTTASGDNGYATGYVCDNECEADSLQCANDGGTWTNTGASTCNGYSCKMSNCLQSDTLWLNDSKAACQDIRGSNNYALVDTNDVCEHRGHCCALDSLIEGDSCKWRCEYQDSLCALNKGNFSYAIVADTAVSGSDTAYTGLCYNNCFMHASKDSLTGLVTGNVAAVDNTSMAVGTYYPDGFSGIRSDYGGIYTYDFLSDETYEWADSLLSAPCSVGMYRGIKNGKYVYWKSGQPVPEGVTNVVKVK